MSASITAVLALESPRTLPSSPKTVIFDTQLWFGDGQPTLVSQLRYFNTSNMQLNDEVAIYVVHANVSPRSFGTIRLTQNNQDPSDA
jgi:hypothetical protein